MTLTELQNSFRQEASHLGDYGLLSKTELANGYCDAEEEEFKCIDNQDMRGANKYNTLKSYYFSALMLRYWYKIFEWMANSSSLLLEQEEYVNWLYKGFDAAFYYKAWRDEYQAKYKFGKFVEWKLDENGEKIPNPYYYVNDPNAPDKIFNRCIFSVRGKEYQYYNKLKRKDGVHKESLDGMLDEDGDCAALYAGTYTNPDLEFGASELVRELIDRDELIEALIADGIINGDCFKSEKIVMEFENKDGEIDKVKNSTANFNERKLVKHLNGIDEAYLVKFCNLYNVKPVVRENLFQKVSKMNSSKYYKAIEKFQYEMRQNSDLLSLIVAV